MPDRPLYPGSIGCAGGAAAERAGAAGAQPPWPDPRRRGRGAGLCGGAVFQGKGRRGAGRLLRADLPGSERVLLTDRCKTVRHGGVDRRARGAAICAERCRPGRPVQPASGGLHRRGGADPRRAGCAGGACPGQGVCVRSGRQFTGAAAPRSGGLQDRKPVHAHDLYRQPRHRQDHHCPAGGKVPQGHRCTQGRAAGGGDPRRPCGALHRSHRPADQQRHRERTGGRFVH